MSLKDASQKHEALYQELIAVIARYDLPPPEMLAVVSNLVGKLVAMQDQRTMTPRQALKVVGENIEHGNRQALIDMLTRQDGTA